MNAMIMLVLIALPILVALFEVGFFGALGLVALVLGYTWVRQMGSLARRPRDHYILDTIPPSHFSEKVRWCMDRLQLDYEENLSLGTLGVFSVGRTVPRLRFQTGAVWSSIGNSSHILRYLYGQCAANGDAAQFLQPTLERLQHEKELDRYAVALQQWVYFHVIDEKELVLSVWGSHDSRVPAWQRLIAPLYYPLARVLIRRAFKLSQPTYVEAKGKIEQLLEETESRMEHNGSPSGESTLNFVDISFCAFSSLWLNPDTFAGRRDDSSRLDEALLPVAMRADIDSWREAYPRCVEYVERLYAEQRIS